MHLLSSRAPGRRWQSPSGVVEMATGGVLSNEARMPIEYHRSDRTTNAGVQAQSDYATVQRPRAPWPSRSLAAAHVEVDRPARLVPRSATPPATASKSTYSRR